MTAITELKIGPDRACISDGKVLVFAIRDMADWTVREFQRRPIYFQGGKYFLKRKTPGPPPYAFTYELAPWAGEPGQESSASITYDEAYVEEREQRHRTDRKHERIYPALLCLYPLLGLAWSGFKERVLGPLGFDPVSITSASTFMIFCIFMLEGIFVFYFHGGLIAPFCGRTLYESVLWLDRALLIVLPMDAAVRYSQVIRGDSCPDGFLEWIFKGMFRKS